MAGQFGSTFRETIDRAELVTGGTVFLLLGDGCEIGDVILGRHGHAPKPDASEGGMTVDEGVVFGVDVEEIEGARARGEVCLDVAKEATQQTVFERMKEEREDGLRWEWRARGIGFMEQERRKDGRLL